MSMEPILLGVAAPAIVSGASTVGRAVDTVTQPFRHALQNAGQLLTAGTNSEAALPSSMQATGEGDMKLAMLSELLAGKSPNGSPASLSIEDIRTHATELQADIEKRIQEALASAGIKLESPLRLRVSGLDGMIEVSGIHAQREVIEAALNHDATLAADFQRLSNELEILDIHGRSKTFAKGFATEPWRMIATQAGRDNQRHEALLELTDNNDRLQLRFD